MGIMKLVILSGKGRKVADCGKLVHMQLKDRNGAGPRVYQVRKREGHEIFNKKDKKYPSPPPLPQLKTYLP